MTDVLFLANHLGIAEEAGILNIMEYRYFNPVNKGLDIEGMLEDLSVSIIHNYFNVIHLPFKYPPKTIFTRASIVHHNNIY